MEFVGCDESSATAAFSLVRLHIHVHVLFACLRVSCGHVLDPCNSAVSVSYDAS